jgi:hypothetical protein
VKPKEGFVRFQRTHKPAAADCVHPTPKVSERFARLDTERAASKYPALVDRIGKTPWG